MAAAYRALSDDDAAAVGERVCAIVRDGDKLPARAAKKVFEELVEGSPGGGDGVGSVERLIDLAWHSGGFEWAGGPTLLERFGPRPALIEFLAARWNYIAGESLGVAELVLRVAYLARWRHLLVAIAHRLEPADRLAMARACVVALEMPQGESAVLAVGGVAEARAELCWALAVSLWLDDDGTGTTAPLVEAASTVVGVEKVWLKTRSRSRSREPFVQLADRLYELTNGSNFLASSAAARALGAWLVAGEAAGGPAMAYIKLVLDDSGTLLGEVTGPPPAAHGAAKDGAAAGEATSESSERHRSILAALGALSRSAHEETARRASDQIVLCLDRPRSKGPMSHELASMYYGLADARAAPWLPELLTDSAENAVVLATETALDACLGLAARPAAARHGADEGFLRDRLSAIARSIATGIDHLTQSGDARDAVRWLGALRRLVASHPWQTGTLATAGPTDVPPADGSSPGSWLVARALDGSTRQDRDFSDTPGSKPIGEWLELWLAVTHASSGEASANEARAALQRLGDEGTSSHIRAAAIALRWLATDESSEAIRIHIEPLEAALAALVDAPAGFVRHPERLIDAVRLAALQDIARGVASASARAELATTPGASLLERRLAAAVQLTFRWVLEELGRLGDDADDYGDKASPYYGILLDILEQLSEDRPALWGLLLRPGESGEPAIVAHPALERGLFRLLADRAKDVKPITDFVDFCLEWLVARRASVTACTRLGLSLRMLDTLHSHGAHDELWKRLAGRAASRQVTRRLAACYRRKTWATAETAALLEVLSAGDCASDGYAQAWKLMLELTSPAAASEWTVASFAQLDSPLAARLAGAAVERSAWPDTFAGLVVAKEVAGRIMAFDEPSAAGGGSRLAAIHQLVAQLAPSGPLCETAAREVRGPLNAPLQRQFASLYEDADRLRARAEDALAELPSNMSPEWTAFIVDSAAPSRGARGPSAQEPPPPPDLASARLLLETTPAHRHRGLLELVEWAAADAVYSRESELLNGVDTPAKVVAGDQRDPAPESLSPDRGDTPAEPFTGEQSGPAPEPESSGDGTPVEVLAGEQSGPAPEPESSDNGTPAEGFAGDPADRGRPVLRLSSHYRHHPAGPPLRGTRSALDALDRAAHAAMGLAKAAGWSDIAGHWRSVGAEAFLADLADLSDVSADPWEAAVEELPLEAAVARLRALDELAGRAETALDALLEAMGPTLGAEWVREWLGRDDEGRPRVIEQLGAPWREVRRLVGDPSPVTAHTELTRSPGDAAPTWPERMRMRFAYEVMVRGFAPVEALRAARFDGVQATVARRVSAFYSTAVQLSGVLVLLLVWVLDTVFASRQTSGILDPDGQPICAAVPHQWILLTLLIVPLVVALVPPCLLAFGALADRRNPSSLPLLAGRLALPRLWAANVIGITFLAMGDEGWSQMLRAHGIGFVGPALLAVLALLYMVFEVQRVSGSPRRRRASGKLGSVLPRALRLALIGLNQCAVLALAAQVYVGPTILPRLTGDVPAEFLSACISSPAGPIYPNALLVWTAGALFFGLLIQVLWEDRPLSEGLD